MAVEYSEWSGGFFLILSPGAIQSDVDVAIFLCQAART